MHIERDPFDTGKPTIYRLHAADYEWAWLPNKVEGYCVQFIREDDPENILECSWLNTCLYAYGFGEETEYDHIRVYDDYKQKTVFTILMRDQLGDIFEEMADHGFPCHFEPVPERIIKEWYEKLHAEIGISAMQKWLKEQD